MDWQHVPQTWSSSRKTPVWTGGIVLGSRSKSVHRATEISAVQVACIKIAYVPAIYAQ